MSNPRIALIAAQASNRVIGRDNSMPWHLPEDLSYFKRVTMGKPVVMGRKTFESIGRPLPGRLNIVITRQKDWSAATGMMVVHSVDEALELAVGYGAENGLDEVMVIGGAQIYERALPLAERVYLTQIQQSFDGDAVFPPLGDEWRQVACEDCESAHSGLKYSFLIFDRVT